MKAETTKDARYYEALPYTVMIRKDDEGDFVARIAEFPGCIAHGENEASAIERLRSVQRLWIEEALSVGTPIPEPERDEELPSGKWIQRVPRRLHKELVDAAKLDNVSLNQLVTSMLSEKLAVRNCKRAWDVFLSHRFEDRDAMYAMWSPTRRVAAWAIDARAPVFNVSEALAHVWKIRSSDKVEQLGEKCLMSHAKEGHLARR